MENNESNRSSFNRTENNSGEKSERRSDGRGDFRRSAPREGGFGSRDDRPRRDFGSRDDRPRRDFGGRDDRPRRDFGGRDDRPRRDFGGRERNFESNQGEVAGDNFSETKSDSFGSTPRKDNIVDNTNTNYLFGMHPIMEAINIEKKIEKVYLKKGLEGELFHQLLEILMEKEIPFQFVPIERLDRITSSNHQGAIATISQVDHISIEEVIEKAKEKEENPIVILLDGVTDVRNFGGIARTAECAGASAVIVPAKGGAAINADAIKTSAGALLRLNTAKVPNLKTAIFLLKEAGFNIVAATEKSEESIYSVNMLQPTAIIMGSEDKGISSSILELCDAQVSVPMTGGIGSLNVSVAAAVVLYEAVRQRTEKPKVKRAKVVKPEAENSEVEKPKVKRTKVVKPEAENSEMDNPKEEKIEAEKI